MTGRRDDRSPEALQYRRWYSLAAWKGPHGRRAMQLAAEPLCRMCTNRGRITPATVVDHVDPKAKATFEGFFNSPVQSLCKVHHDSTKQQQERSGYSTEVGLDGYPLDPMHPANL